MDENTKDVGGNSVAADENNVGGDTPERGIILTVTYACNEPNGESLSETVDFPARQSVIDALLEKAGLSEVDGVDPVRKPGFYVTAYHSDHDWLEDALAEIVADAHPNELNALAGRITALDEDGLEDFADMLQTNSVGFDSIANLLKLAEQCDGKSAMQVYFEHADRSENVAALLLPTTAEHVRRLLADVGVTDADDVFIAGVRSHIPFLGYAALVCAENGAILDELNYLAAKAQALDGDGREILSAVLEAERHNASIADIINITENLGNFELEPAFSPEMLGDHLRLCGMDDCSEGFRRLEASDDEALRGVLKYVDMLEKYFDAAAYGKAYSQNENGAFTEVGYLTEGTSFREVYRDRSDVPAGYRVLPNDLPPLLKAEDVDLLPFLVKAQAVSDKLTHSVDRAVRDVAAGQCEDYLLVVNGGQLFVTEAQAAYQRGDGAHTQLQAELGKPKARAFQLHVTGRGGTDDDGVIKGDITELRRDALLADIKSHGVMPDRVDVVGANGSMKSYDLLEWADTSAAYRSEAQSITRHYSGSDLRGINGVFNKFAYSNARKAAAIDETALLSELSAAFMPAEYPRSDMLCISNAAAREILTRYHADVYALTESGPLKIPPIEAAKGRFTEREDLAVKREDTAGLDKYAHNVVKKQLREPERGERDKSKNKGGGEL